MYRLGFDIGGTHIACGIINDETFEIVGKDGRCIFPRSICGKNPHQCMAGIGKNTAARCGTDFQQIETVGVAYREASMRRTERLLTPITSAFIIFRFGKLIKETFNKPAAMLNDADAALLRNTDSGCCAELGIHCL